MKKLEPARLAIARRGSRLHVERYWDVTFEPDERATEAELVEQLRELLVEVGHPASGERRARGRIPERRHRFERRGRDDVPQSTRSPSRPSRSGFHEASFNELSHARRIAALHGTDHHELVLEPDVVPLVEDLAWYLDEPFGDTSAIATYMVSKLAAEHVKVVLTGDGGDEIFAGYDKYVVEGRERAYDRMPASLRRAAGAVGDGHARGHARAPVSPAPRSRRIPPVSRRRRRCSRRMRCASCSRVTRAAQMAHYRPVGGVAVASRWRPRLDVRGSVRRSPDLPAPRRPDQGRSDDHGALD